MSTSGGFVYYKSQNLNAEAMQTKYGWFVRVWFIMYNVLFNNVLWGALISVPFNSLYIKKCVCLYSL